MKRIPSLGEQEMQLLKFIGAHAPVSVREVSDNFEQKLGLARTTILTMMERLRKKGFLNRSKVDGIFKYNVKIETGDVLSHKISDFIERTLGGSMSPLLNHFISNSKLTAEEVKQLKSLAAKLEKEKGE